MGAATTSFQTQLDTFAKATGDQQSVEINSDALSAEQTGVIYARVSSQQQANEDNIETQIENMKEIADRENIEVWGDPIRDEGKSGENFVRSGFIEMIKKAGTDYVDVVLVDDIDRLGRDVMQTFFHIHRLYRECDVTLVTNDGHIDLDTVSGKAETAVKALSADIENSNKRRRAITGSIKQFKNRDWSVYFDSAWPGYELIEREDGTTWLELQEDEAEVVKDLHRQFLGAETPGAYSEVIEYVESEVDDEIIETVSYNDLKNIFTDPLYEGRPTRDSSSVQEFEGGPVVVKDDSLKIFDSDDEQRLRAAVQRKVEQIKQKNSSNKHTVDPVDVVEEYDLSSVLEINPNLELHCKNCDTAMVRNGTREVRDITVHKYRCTECSEERHYPTLSDLEMLHYRSSEE